MLKHVQYITAKTEFPLDLTNRLLLGGGRNQTNVPVAKPVKIILSIFQHLKRKG